MPRLQVRAGPSKSDSFCCLSPRNGRETRQSRFSENCGKLSTPSLASRQSALRSGHTTDPLELEERYGSGKELLRGCRIVPPHLNEGHSSNTIAKLRERQRPARPFHHSPPPSAAKGLGSQMKSQCDTTSITWGNSVPWTTFSAIHRRRKRGDYGASGGPHLAQAEDSVAAVISSKAPGLGDAHPQLSHGGMGNSLPGRTGLSSFQEKQEDVIVTEEDNLTKRGVLCHGNDTRMPQPVSIEVTGRLTPCSQSSSLATLTSSLPRRGSAISRPSPDSKKTLSGAQRSDECSELKPGVDKATTLSIDTWLEPFRKRINILSDLCRDMVHDIELTISRHRLARGPVHNVMEEGNQRASVNSPTSTTISFGGFSHTTQPRIHELAIRRKSVLPTTTAAGDSTYFPGFEPNKWRHASSPPRDRERHLRAGPGYGATGEAHPGHSQPSSSGGPSFVTALESTSRGSASSTHGSTSALRAGLGDEEHARVDIFTKHLAELARILRITNPDAVKRKLFVAENCPFLIPPNEADDFFAFSIILYSLTLPQNYRWNQGVYKLSAAVSSRTAY
ncbi:conserved hypothetical protein [Neospora caninum Liverpool]|uniref:Uncharacterized protein n=1 Tax=Neospora caninum (strain Liverpool) TaxID=572307 RepID=F0VI24_NEOCL|nr:conserved hypothetical protein [Neospora caninum Liverpool]CBZ53385.1 conserved hypothetical protein [Neospora caninum Liverpool]CEL67371.1 TPA: hypothetical protein BN1204_031720 [Neospora caninum Liverpool]|eukprot:XP_003883417.1 conserved hypothetical protein [Neospora caninum Liverpool]